MLNCQIEKLEKVKCIKFSVKILSLWNLIRNNCIKKEVRYFANFAKFTDNLSNNRLHSIVVDYNGLNWYKNYMFLIHF